MEQALALLGGALVGALATVSCVLALRTRHHRPNPARLAEPELARRGVEALTVGLAIIDPDDRVVFANPAARALGMVRARQLAQPALRGLARQARHLGESRDAELEMPRPPQDPLAVRVRAIPLDIDGHLAVEVTDVTEAHRVAQVRKDFVANVSHELKTPVGALSLLAEALGDATDDPAAVRRFADHVRHEATRLGRLVQELIELSRLQGADPLPDPALVPVERVIAEVLDRTRLAADAKGITVVAGRAQHLAVAGSESQLVTALSNLVDNAIVYSGDHTRVTIAARSHEGRVEIAVTDQGIGIEEKDLGRIFERFYRADPARSRATGGTGLGLAIVKHIATNHGGSVDVWSVPGSGSTFTLRLPEVAGPGVTPVSIVEGTG